MPRALRALISVSDKTGVVDFAKGLESRGWEIISTGGTSKALRDAGVKATDISDVTNFPEMLDGRVKTLHPAVHGGLLARRDLPEHMAAIEEHKIAPIDLVAVNLYPFRETAARQGVTPEEVIEQIDIGGPSMLRSAAKNFASVTVVVDPHDYPRVLAALDANDDDIDLRCLLAEKTFAHTAAYDAMINTWFAKQRSELFPELITPTLQRQQQLRYGENPDQRAAFYVERPGAGLAGLKQKGGKELSFNNLLDLEGALLTTDSFENEIACAIIKHTTPCGLATGGSALEAYKKALACDPVSAFGSVISFTTTVDDETAEVISNLFVECIVAPKFTEGAVEILGRKKNLRVLEGTAKWTNNALDYKRVRGGLLTQERTKLQLEGLRGSKESTSHSALGDREAGSEVSETPETRNEALAEWSGSGASARGRANVDLLNPSSGWTVVTKTQPTTEQMKDLMFVWRAVGSVKSNAIVLARDGATIGIGAGQMSRVDAAFMAVHKAQQAGHITEGSALGSDAFFPFRDGVDQAAQAGVKAIVQPGGSVRDEEVIQAANEHGIAMVFTGQRQFRH